MTLDEILEGVRRVAKAAEAEPNPIAALAGAGLELVVDAITMAQGDDDDAREMLAFVRKYLQDKVAADWERAINGDVG